MEKGKDCIVLPFLIIGDKQLTDFTAACAFAVNASCGLNPRDVVATVEFIKKAVMLVTVLGVGSA